MASKSPGDDFGFFLIIIGVVALAWLGAGAPGNSGYSSGGQYSPPNDVAGITKEVTRIDSEVQVLKKEAEKNKLIGPISNLGGVIEIEAANIWSDDPDQEYITLRVSPEAKGKILLTGMELRSAITGAGVPIGKGIPLYGFPGEQVEQSIYVNPDDTIYVISGRSPISYSFRTNKCSGYLGQSRNFSPPIYNNCPSTLSDLGYPSVPLRYRDACYNYLDGLSSCHVPGGENLPEELGPECAGFITTEFSYNKCVERHKNDLDFYKGEWRVYLNRPEDTWQGQREFIKLLDQSKKTIDYVEI